MRIGFRRFLAACLLTCHVSHGVAADAAKHLAEAVRFKTVSHQDTSLIDRDAFRGLHGFLRETYPLTFTRLEVEVINEFSLILSWPGNDSALAPVLFTAHLDVVPIEPNTEDNWTHPGFAGVIEDGVVYGRGTLDDKGGVISLLEATELLLGEGFDPERSLVFAFGHDEEVSGTQGAAFIAKRLKEKDLHFVWMVDEGGLLVTESELMPNRILALVNVAEKAYYTLRLTATGAGGHSSMPPKQTSVGRLSAAIARIEANPFESRLQEPVSSMLEALAPYSDFPRNVVLENLWLTAPLVVRSMEGARATRPMVRTTTAVTMFNGGVKENVVPQQAVAYINFRLIPGDTRAMVLKRVTALVDDPQIRIEPVRDEPPTPPVADSSGPGFRAIERAVAGVYPEAVVLPSLLVATTDTRHYTDLADDHYRFHGMASTQADTQGIHGTDEKIRVDSFERAVEIAVGMLRESGMPPSTDTSRIPAR